MLSVGVANSASFPTSPQAAFGAPASPAPSSTPDPTAAADSPFAQCEQLADTLLAEIAAGFQSLASIAAAHHIPYPRFTLWLLQPATQQRLTDLSVAVAGAARLTATAALPDIVRGLKTTLEQLNSPAHAAVAPPGADPLRAQALTLRRHRAVTSASALLYRIARFTCPSAHPTSPRPKAGARAPVPSLPPLPRLTEIKQLDDDDVPAPSTFPLGEAVAPRPVGASAFSHIIDLDLESPMSQEDAIEHLAEEFSLTDDQVAALRADPAEWIRANLLAPRAHTSADDG